MIIFNINHFILAYQEEFDARKENIVIVNDFLRFPIKKVIFAKKPHDNEEKTNVGVDYYSI